MSAIFQSRIATRLCAKLCFPAIPAHCAIPAHSKVNKLRLPVHFRGFNLNPRPHGIKLDKGLKSTHSCTHTTNYKAYFSGIFDTSDFKRMLETIDYKRFRKLLLYPPELRGHSL
jgi:hypothetical protein